VVVYRAGFDDLTPQQSDFFSALGNARELEIPGFQPELERRKLPDTTAEIRSAAVWARGLLERGAETRIGIIVPNLKRLRPKVQRIFQAALNPAGAFDDPERSFHVSLGPALDGHPLIHAALLILDFSLDGLALPRAGMLLRSPFLAGAEAEWSHRALLDAKLRRKGAWDLRPQRLREAAGSCPLLQQALLRFEKALEKVSGEWRASEWAGHFSKLLEALGWPGERPLNRREFQVVEAWRTLLSDFAALDCVAPPMTFDTALRRLREAAASTVFQVENEGSNVQIMGMLEASGLRFDHLWIMGLDDETLPAPANPNPFLPLALQQEFNLPHCSPDRELVFARDLIERLTAGAPHVALSYPERDGDRQLAPSPLLAGAWLSAAGDAMPAEKWMAGIRAGAQFERLLDQSAPPVSGASIQKGGTSLFKDMAACPFRAFAAHRLDAKPLEASTLGLSYADHGAGVHKALELIWSELGSHARLAALDSAELQRLVARNVAAAIANLPARLGRKLEQRRLEKLLIDWLAIEKSRSPFVAHKPEQESLVEIGGLQVKTRADRVDRFPDGREIILDYKTGQLNLHGWETDRPDEPQLPLYCATSARPAAGAVLVSIRAGELGFRGLTDAGISLPGMKEMRMAERVAFSRQVAVWKQVLERLARNFQAGQAEVEPKEHACDHCGLWALCRIREFENDRG